MAIYGWIFEPVDDPDGPHGHHDEDGDHGDGGIRQSGNPPRNHDRHLPRPLRRPPLADTAAVSHGHGTGTGLSNNKLLMWVFLGSECLLFGGLISTYLIYRSRFGDGPGLRVTSSTSRSPRSARSCC